jgi:hypothetical protein
MVDGLKEWTAAWQVIAQSLKEMKVSDVDENARAILARLSHAGMIVVFADEQGDKAAYAAFHQLRGMLAGTTSCDSVEYVRSIRDEEEL